MASLDSILTSAQNIATAISDLRSAYLNVQGARNACDISTATLIKTGPGRLAMVSITTAGAQGAIYDANSASATTNLMWVIPASKGIIFVNLPYSFGLVVTPGAGQTVTVSWS